MTTERRTVWGVEDVMLCYLRVGSLLFLFPQLSPDLAPVQSDSDGTGNVYETVRERELLSLAYCIRLTTPCHIAFGGASRDRIYITISTLNIKPLNLLWTGAMSDPAYRAREETSTSPGAGASSHPYRKRPYASACAVRTLMYQGCGKRA